MITETPDPMSDAMFGKRVVEGMVPLNRKTPRDPVYVVLLVGGVLGGLGLGGTVLYWAIRLFLEGLGR